MITDIFLFYLFASLAIISATMVITLTNAVHSVLFLIIVFCNVASLLLIIGTEFFSFMFLIVYVGAIAVLFLFVVMMLNVKTSPVTLNIFSTCPANSGFGTLSCIKVQIIFNLFYVHYNMERYGTFTV